MIKPIQNKCLTDHLQEPPVLHPGTNQAKERTNHRPAHQPVRVYCECDLNKKLKLNSFSQY